MPAPRRWRGVRRRRLRTCCRTRTAPRSGHLSKGARRSSLRRWHASCEAQDCPATLSSRRRPAGRERRPFSHRRQRRLPQGNGAARRARPPPDSLPARGSGLRSARDGRRSRTWLCARTRRARQLSPSDVIGEWELNPADVLPSVNGGTEQATRPQPLERSDEQRERDETDGRCDYRSRVCGCGVE